VLRSLVHELRLLAWSERAEQTTGLQFVGLCPAVDATCVQAFTRGFAWLERLPSERGTYRFVIGAWQRSAGRQQLIDGLVARDGAACVWCSCTLDPYRPEATLDHVQPKSQGGRYELENLLLACVRCNRSRRDRPAAQFLALCLRAGHAVRVEAVEAALERQLPPELRGGVMARR
jgi:hypothetical protein